jgi:hypothetical protein
MRAAIRQAGEMARRKPRIVPVFAMPIERAAVRKPRSPRLKSVACRCTLALSTAAQIVAIVTGMGTDLRWPAPAACSTVPVEWVLVVGITGALKAIR